MKPNTTRTHARDKCLLIGFGDIGGRLARLLPPAHYQVTAISRRAKACPGYIELSQCDATNEAQVASFLKECVDVVVITLTPDAYNDEAYHRTYVRSMEVLVRVLRAAERPPRRVLFVSSTSVYGQRDGSWVDEASPTEPAGYAGRRLLEAESLLLDSGLPGCVVRFSGIYGPGRERLIGQVRAGEGCAREPVVYTNRIHADDCAGVLAHLIQYQGALAPVYLATDCMPAPLWEVKRWLAAEMGLPEGHLREEPVNTRRGSKRCANRMLLETGYRFLYPTFREGYSAVLESLGG